MAASTGRLPLMAGNWKMNLNHLEAIAVVQKLAFALTEADLAACDHAGTKRQTIRPVPKRLPQPGDLESWRMRQAIHGCQTAQRRLPGLSRRLSDAGAETHGREDDQRAFIFGGCMITDHQFCQFLDRLAADVKSKNGLILTEWENQFLGSWLNRCRQSPGWFTEGRRAATDRMWMRYGPEINWPHPADLVTERPRLADADPAGCEYLV